MRKLLEGLSVAGLLLVWGMTLEALYGRQRLPDRIATHFDAAGHVNGWGTPGMLWMFPVIVTLVYALMSVVVRFPQAFNYPVPVTTANREELQALAVSMVAWLKLELVALFGGVQWLLVESGRRGAPALSSAHTAVAIWLSIGVVWVTIGCFVAAMFRLRPRRRATGPRG